MTHKRTFWTLAIILVISLVGCQSADPTAATEAGSTGLAERAGGLGGVNALALGTLALEDTEHAVTREQARALLPLWQMVQGGSLQGDAETQAVLKQIEGEMTASQLMAIEAMALTMDDMQTALQARGVEMPAPTTGRQAAPGNLQGLSEDERAQMREQFQNMTAEERATRMAELGMEVPEARQGGAPPSGAFGGRQANLILEPLITLLNERASR
jgi:hypothetical protein